MISLFMLALGVGVASSMYVPSEVDAHVKGLRLNSLAAGCGQLQYQYDQAVRDYAKATQGTQTEYDAAKAHLISIIQLWNDSPCSKAYGSLVFRTAPSVKETVRSNVVAPTLARQMIHRLVISLVALK